MIRVIHTLSIALLLLCAGCSKAPQRPPFLPPADPVLPQETALNVRVDYSHLTPYVRTHDKHKRLHDGPLPELIPSQDYTMLLPYASAATLNNGELRETKYGFVTIDGLVVTDLVYDRLERAISYDMILTRTHPAYRLAINAPGTETQWNFAETRQAACALDGSWITPFDYTDIVFTEDVIILVRDYQSFDVEVCDYDCRRLYNIRETDWIDAVSQDMWLGNMIYSIHEGFGCIQMQDGTYAFIDILTGQAVYTEFTGAYTFSEGLAPVSVRDFSSGGYPELWGYINRDFELVIPPRFVNSTMFMNGCAVGEVPSGSKHIIDKEGKTLLTVGSDFYVLQEFGGSGFSVHSNNGAGSATYYTSDITEIKLPVKGRSQPDQYIYSIQDGWRAFEDVDISQYESNGTVLFKLDEEYYFPGVSYISYADGEYIIYTENTEMGPGTGILALNGNRDILAPEPDVSVTAVIDNNKVKAFIINKSSYMYFVQQPYKMSTYKLLDTDGGVITSGPGILNYDEAIRLYSVLCSDYYEWLDPEGNVIISIPMMSYTID